MALLFTTTAVKIDQESIDGLRKAEIIVNITNNFQRIIGRGGFGTFYYGEMQDGTQVAVKMLSEQSIRILAHPSEFSTQFQTEVCMPPMLARRET